MCSVSLLVFLILCSVCVQVTLSCGPGRLANWRRYPSSPHSSRKLVPLVFRQHSPNSGERATCASGPAERPVTREDPERMRELVPNYSRDIVFRDEEGTGVDRLMTQVIKDRDLIV